MYGKIHKISPKKLTAVKEGLLSEFDDSKCQCEVSQLTPLKES